MDDYYFEYKEGESTYSGIVTAPTEHSVNSVIRDILEDIPWSTKQGNEFVGVFMFTPTSQLENVDQYVETQESPYTVQDWSERVERSLRLEEDGDDIIVVER